MKDFNVVILGCGTVGGGVAQILINENKILQERSGVKINLKGILDLFPKKSSERHGIDISYFYKGTDELTKDEASSIMEEIICSKEVDLIVETIGGSSEFMKDLAIKIITSGKSFVTANKALISKYKNDIFTAAAKSNISLGFEASVCGAIPILRGISECFAGDIINSFSGILNGTSNYILSKMKNDNLSFDEALKLAQEKGYAEADPSLDINGGDAGHKLSILLRLVFGIDVSDNLHVQGIENVTEDDITFAEEMDCTVKLVGYAQKKDENIYAAVQPMMVKNNHLLAKINNATNAVKLNNKYSQSNTFIGEGAGSLETGSAIVSDIVFIARYGDLTIRNYEISSNKFCSFEELDFAYHIIFETEDIPGITGIVTTAIGDQSINIDSVSHNRHNRDGAVFSIATMPCKYSSILKVIEAIKKEKPNLLTSEPKIYPVLLEDKE